MAKYPVLDTLDHNKKRYLPGTSVELTKEQAAPLILLKVIGEAEAEKAGAKESPEKNKPAT